MIEFKKSVLKVNVLYTFDFADEDTDPSYYDEMDYWHQEEEGLRMMEEGEEEEEGKEEEEEEGEEEREDYDDEDFESSYLSSARNLLSPSDRE